MHPNDQHRNWTEIWDEFNDVPVWVNSLTGVSQYQLPRLQDPPLLPNVLLDQDTGEMMSPPSSMENEVDSNSDEESQYSETGERLFSEKPAPRGKEEEFELAAGRVLEIRRQQLRSRYF